MSPLIFIIISFIVGGIFGYFVAALLVLGKISDLEYEIMSLKNYPDQLEKSA